MTFFSVLIIYFVALSEGNNFEPIRQLTKSSVSNEETSTVSQQYEEVIASPIREENTTHFESASIQCGIRPHVKSGRIVGGKDAAFGAWPWQALVRELNENNTFTHNYYGGVLIDKNYVLTVAHRTPEPNTLAVVFGEFDISKNNSLENEKPSVLIKVKHIIIHPGFNNRTFDDDLAVLELENAISFDSHIVPICMPVHGKKVTRRLATVTGWGSLRYGGAYPSVLQEVQVPIIENELCQEWIESLGYTKDILPSTLCAGFPKGEKDACLGDSGGPLVSKRLDGRWELIGTVSGGIKCGFPRLPGFYMNIAHYKPWIQNITGLSFDDAEINTRTTTSDVSRGIRT